MLFMRKSEPTSDQPAEDASLPDAANARAPHSLLRLREWFTVIEFMIAWLSKGLLDHWPRGAGQPVLIIPGFLAGPASTGFLRAALHRLGYLPYDWGLGRNLGYRPRMLDHLPVLIRRLHSDTGHKVSIIGWSAGGIYARELARTLPDDVAMVITLGSPFRGNHRASHAWRVWELLNGGPDAADTVTEAARLAREKPLDIPTTCIYSKSDGIVGWECCTSLPAPRTENVEVRSTHLGYGHNLETLYVIADRLAQQDRLWQPFGTSIKSKKNR